jgi:hypothetical protein
LVLVAGAALPQARTLAVSSVRQQPAQEQRVALVIGNSDYAEAPLRNPVNDARAIAAELRQTRFKVVLLENANLQQMFEAIRDFGDELRSGGVGLFYFAGHGVQIRGRNYLIPVSTQIQREDEVVYRSIDAGQVLQKMETAGNRVNLVILDACRNNPFARTFRSMPAGLAVMEAPVNTLVAFATAPGAVASDGTGKHGLYTEHLLKNITVEGLRVEDMFKRVRMGVRQDSSGRQTPWENTSLEVEFFFRPLASQLAPEPIAPGNPLAVELAFWDSIKTSGQWADFDAYLRKFPGGQFSELARNRLTVLKPPLPVAPAAPPAPVAVAAVQQPPPQKPARPPLTEPFKVLTGSEVAATAVAVAPNGGYVVTGGRDGVLTLWDVSTSKELRRLMGHAGAILSVAVSPDARWIASSAEDGTWRLWSSSGINEVRRVRLESVVTTLAFSPNGRHIASGDRAGAVRLWNAADGSAAVHVGSHSAAVRSVAFSLEGRYVISGSADGFARLWPPAMGAQPRNFGPHAGPVIAVRMSPDQASLVSASADGVMWSWDVRSGKGTPNSVAIGAAMVALSADARNALIARDDGSTVLWDTGGARELQRFSSPASAVTAIALSSEARLGMVAADGQRIRLWSMRE